MNRCPSAGKLIRSALAALLVTVVLSAGRECWAQSFGQGSATFPPSPTLSPYLGLLRRGDGVLPNYHQFVRPQLQVRRSLAAQNRSLQLQRAGLTSLNRRLNAFQSQASRPAATGSSAGFFRYSHFYPALSQ